MSIINFLIKLPSLIVIKLINFYQLTLSPDHSWLKVKYPYGYCRHYPSCSEYSKQAITKHGLIKGGWFAVKRVAKCNSLTEPKIDIIPN